MAKHVCGTYHKYGYEVWLHDADSDYPEQLYHAGNSPHDSQYITDDPDYMLDIETLKQYCIKTCQEMAAEQGVEFTGVDLEESDQ